MKLSTDYNVLLVRVKALNGLYSKRLAHRQIGWWITFRGQVENCFEFWTLLACRASPQSLWMSICVTGTWAAAVDRAVYSEMFVYAGQTKALAQRAAHWASAQSCQRSCTLRSSIPAIQLCPPIKLEEGQWDPLIGWFWLWHFHRLVQEISGKI